VSGAPIEDHEADEARYMNGKLVKGDVASIEEYWTEDSVAFLSKFKSDLTDKVSLMAQSAAHSPLSRH
jgi:uncharacterized protein YcsI (UPF0317 family)